MKVSTGSVHIALRRQAEVKVRKKRKGLDR